MAKDYLLNQKEASRRKYIELPTDEEMLIEIRGIIEDMEEAS